MGSNRAKVQYWDAKFLAPKTIVNFGTQILFLQT